MNLNLKLKRNHGTDGYTAGSLFVESKFFCNTLEDQERETKVQNKTAIPCGKYEIVMTYSNRFKKIMPLLLDVPNFTGIRIHAGNTVEHTEGCILLGSPDGNPNDAWLGNSRVAVKAFDTLIAQFKKQSKTGKIFITII